MAFHPEIDKVRSLVRIIPTPELKVGDTYELDIMQVVNGEVVGGLTYVIHIVSP